EILGTTSFASHRSASLDWMGAHFSGSQLRQMAGYWPGNRIAEGPRGMAPRIFTPSSASFWHRNFRCWQNSQIWFVGLQPLELSRYFGTRHPYSITICSEERSQKVAGVWLVRSL